MKHRLSALTATVAVSALALTACASDGGSESSMTADEYPIGDITWVIHAGAGGTSDLTARKLAEGLQDELGVSIIVENREGASGSLAVQHVAEQPADGYTIGYAPVEFALFDGLGFDVDPANYDFLGRLTLAPYVIAVPADSPYETLNDLLDHAADETITVSNAGAASLAGIVALAVGEETGPNVHSSSLSVARPLPVRGIQCNSADDVRRRGVIRRASSTGRTAAPFANESAVLMMRRRWGQSEPHRSCIHC